MRHRLKPQGYLRYGDDFIIVASNRRQVRAIRAEAEMFLARELGLYLHPRNDVIVAAEQGLHFLGHVVTPRYVVVDRYTSRAALQKVHMCNVSSYAALHLATYVKRELHWRLLDQLDEAGGV